MDSGRTDFTVALVPTAMKAGVRISPCGVVMVPVRPRNSPPLAVSWTDDGAQRSARRVPTVNENCDCSAAAAGVDVAVAGMAGEGLAGTVPVCQLSALFPQWSASDVG
jgi:hypothetical protein